MKDLYVVIPLFVSMLVLLGWFFNKEVKEIGTDRSEDMIEDKQIDQEMNANIEETIDKKEELHSNSNSILTNNNHLEDFDDYSSWGIEDLLSSKDSIVEDDEENLLSFAINIYQSFSDRQ